MTEPSLIDWNLAERVARGLAGNGTGKRSVRLADLRKATRGSVSAVRDYTGLEMRGRAPSTEVLDRSEWIEANTVSLRAMTAGIEAELSDSLRLPGPLGGGARRAAGAAAGVELGVASGYLAQRVLGQYDVALIGPARPARLLFVAPNLAEARKRLDVDREPFLRWIALHEATHVVQFGAVPWLREHLGSVAQELLAGAFAQVSLERLGRSARTLLTPDPRRLLAALRNGDWLSPFVAAPQRRLMEGLQATMAVVEGYSEHVMDRIGVEIGPAYPELRARVEARRDQRGAIDSILSRVLGLDQKMRQYRHGKAFCDEVVERRGIEVLNLAWSEPEAMPSAAELKAPGEWISRVA